MNAKRNFKERVLKFFSMKPLLVRSFIAAAAAVIAQIFGIVVVDDDAINAIIDLFSSVSALLAYLWGQGTVTANAKVIALKPDPDKSLVVPGNAVIENAQELEATIEAATREAA